MKTTFVEEILQATLVRLQAFYLCLQIIYLSFLPQQKVARHPVNKNGPMKPLAKGSRRDGNTNRRELGE